MYFPVAGVELNPFVPIIVGAGVSLVLGQVGLTGGIATLPYMVSVLSFTSPSVSSTNLIFILISPLGSIYSYWIEKRMLWRLGLLAGAGGILGAALGPWIRVNLLSDISTFKFLFGVIFALVGLRLFFKKFKDVKIGKVERTSGTLLYQSFVFSGNEYTFFNPSVFFAGFLAGAISTSFGIGSGFLLVPFYTTVLKLPIYAIASSALLSTLMISASGTLFYTILNTSTGAAPDFMLGILFGIGGIIGGYASAKAQKSFSSKTLHKALGAVLVLWSLSYLRHGF